MQAKDQAPLLTDIILAVGPACNRTLSSSSSHLVNMKLVAVFVILCRTAHRNNSNYLPLLIALYLYSAGARVDAITLLNHLGLCVSYDVLQKKLRNITASSMSWIKQQSTNRKLIGTWDNFKYRENVHEERLGDTVKFRLVIMALWIENSWRIPATGLQQLMWNLKHKLLRVYDILASIFGLNGFAVQKQCVKLHRFHAFRAGFSSQEYEYSPAMPILNVINYKKEDATKAYAFAPSMFCESSTNGNISVFEDLNIIQMGIDKTDP